MAHTILKSQSFLELMNKGFFEENGLLTEFGLIIVSFGITFAALSAMYYFSPYYTPLFFKGYKSMTKYERADWDTRYGNIIFSIFITYMAGRIVFIDPDFHESGDIPFHFRETRNSYISLGSALGYFLIDTIATVKYMMGGPAMVIHHICALGSIINALINREGHLYTLWMLLTEMTTPFIALRYMLEKMGYKQHVAYAINGVGILVGWVIARIINFVLFYHHFYTYRDQFTVLCGLSKAIVLTVPAFLFFLNIFWFTKIVRGALKLFIPSKPSTDAASEISITAKDMIQEDISDKDD